MNFYCLKHGFFTLLIAIVLAFSCKKGVKVSPDFTPNPDAPFTQVPATEDIVMYEINQRAFSASGTLNGILPRLDSIKSLGVNVIWLMPIHPIGRINGINSPYSVQNYREVNPEYGTMSDLKILVRECHKKNMAVILDWVANHTAWDHSWISNKSWYSQNAAGEIISPTVNGQEWRDVADLNFSNSEMRQEMIKEMKFWIDSANVDGFRCDAADHVPFDFWKQAIDSLQKIPNRKLVLFAEGARSNHLTAGFHLNFGWNFYTKAKNVWRDGHSANVLFNAHQVDYAALPAGKHTLRFTSNHDDNAWDNTPLVIFGGKEASISAFVATALMGGVPMIYNGQEVGCAVKLPFFSKLPINWTTNPDMTRAYKQLMATRAKHKAFRGGTLQHFSSANVLAFTRTKDDDEAMVLVNVRNSAQTFNLPEGLKNSTWKNALNGSAMALAETVNLEPNQYLILAK